jgi:hypothetical protein
MKVGGRENTMSEPFVFLTGMFRSGTTLLARMLNAHPHLVIASDPYFQLLKAFRNAVAEQVFGAENVDGDAPLDDYYFDPEKQKVMTRVQETSLALPIDQSQLPPLRKRIASAAHPYSPKIEPLLEDLQGETFVDLLISGLNIIKRAYGKGETRILGFKEVWTDEFAGHLLRQFPEAKVIHIVRDPRAVCASKNVTDEKYPWLFLTRQWRKLMTFAWMNSQLLFPFSDRVLLIQYEELISNPLQEARRMCTFLGIEFNENLVTPVSFVDGNGKPWLQNSSYFQGEQRFNLDSVNKWQTVLTPTQVEFIESLCFAEMRVFGYQFTALKNFHLRLPLILTPPEVSKDELADWIHPYSLLNPSLLMREMSLEYLRASMLTGDESLSEREKRALCLSPAFFDVARQLCQEAC